MGSLLATTLLVLASREAAPPPVVSSDTLTVHAGEHTHLLESVRGQAVSFAAHLDPVVHVEADEDSLSLDRGEIDANGRVRVTVREWWHQVRYGIEHGFELFEEATDEVIVSLSVSGAKARLVSDTHIVLESGGNEISYQHLYAFDATTQTLPAWFEVVGDRIDIHVLVDDDVSWPVVIDPIAQTPVIVPAPSSIGTTPKFGLATASGNVGPTTTNYADLVVGAPDYDNGQTNEGAVFLYLSNGNSFSATPDLTFESNIANAGFGAAVALFDVNGDNALDLLVGVPGLNSAAGAIYVYLNTNTHPFFSTTESAILHPSIPTGAGFMGSFIVPCNAHGTGTLRDICTFSRSTLYAFKSNVGTIPSANPLAVDLDADDNDFPNWLASGPLTGTLFDVVVGLADGSSPRVSVYGRVGSSFVNKGDRFPPSSSPAPDRFGRSAAIANLDGTGGSLIVPNEGKTYIYWNFSIGEKQYTLPSISPAFSPFSVATNVGDLNQDGLDDLVLCDGGRDGLRGACAVFGGYGYGALFQTTYRLVVSGTQAGQRLGGGGGFTTGNPITSGDMNGDGRRDLMIGDPLFDGAVTDSGRVQVFNGERAGVVSAGSISQQSNDEFSEMGAALANAGDINGDGYEDFAVGAPRFRVNLNPQVGKVRLYFGGPRGSSGLNVHDWVQTHQSANAQFGRAIAASKLRGGTQRESLLICARDAIYVFHGVTGGTPVFGSQVNRPTNSSDSTEFCSSIAARGNLVLVGEPRFSVGASNRGRVLLYRWNGTTLVLVQSQVGTASSQFGTSVAFAQNSGLKAVAGAPNANFFRGQVGYMSASTSSLTAPTFFTWSSAPAGSLYFGAALAAVDVDKDGDEDLAIGAPEYTNGESQEGAVGLFLAGSGTFSASPSAIRQGNIVGGKMGAAVGAGDVNGDGRGDVVIGSPELSNPQDREGKVTVVLGSNFSTQYTNEGAGDNRRRGTAITTVDFDGDGYDDLLDGLPGYTNGQTSEGYWVLSYGGW